MVCEIGLGELGLGQAGLVGEMGPEAAWSKVAEVGLGP